MNENETKGKEVPDVEHSQDNVPPKTKETQIAGECIFCHTFRQIPYEDAFTIAQLRGISEQEAADDLATDMCRCKQGIDFRESKKRLENAAEFMHKIFAENEGAYQMSLCCLKAVDSGDVEKVTFKIGKFSYTIDKDAQAMIRVKTKYTDSQDAKF